MFTGFFVPVVSNAVHENPLFIPLLKRIKKLEQTQPEVEGHRFTVVRFVAPGEDVDVDRLTCGKLVFDRESDEMEEVFERTKAALIQASEYPDESAPLLLATTNHSELIGD